MEMTNSEICASWRQSGQRPAQIQTLAELNLCSPERIREILEEGGYALPPVKERKRPGPKPKPDPKPAAKKPPAARAKGETLKLSGPLSEALLLSALQHFPAARILVDGALPVRVDISLTAEGAAFNLISGRCGDGAA